MTEQTVVSASAEVAAPAATIFELIADPRRQPEWDGNGNLAASTSPRVTAAGQVFEMDNTSGKHKVNHVSVFEEGRGIGWLPADAGGTPPGHLWLWELEPLGADRTRVTHTYDFSHLDATDERRLARARSTTPDRLRASIDRLAALAQSL